jgi:hypothetical protein
MPDINNPQIIGALIALGGVAIGVVSSWVIALINRHYDDRRHMRQLAIETAVEYWKQDIETAHFIGDRTQTTVKINPLDTYIIHMLQLAELVSDKRLTAENTEQELIRIRSISQAAAKAAKKKPNDG